MLNFSKFRLRQKWDQICFFSSLALYLLEVDNLKLCPDFSKAQMRANCTPAGSKILLEL